VSFRELDAGEIIRTIERLSERIEARFPGSGLSSVSRDFLGLSRDAAREADALGAPNWTIRVGVGIVIVTMLATAVVALTRAFSAFGQAAESFGAADMFQTIESLINDIVFLGIAVFFLATIESRIKRRKALERLHQLRSVAHIVDMHQLTKDPDNLFEEPNGESVAPVRAMTRDELARYLDYCGELLSLTGKMAALFVQRFSDSLVMQSVNEIEDLTSGLSRKIWQKITLLGTVAR
jgi:hypothetical protein